VWSAEELREFLEATSKDRLAAMWLLFATTGMRRSELLGLPWRAVDLEASPGRLPVVQTVVVVDKHPVIVADAKTATSRRQLALDPFTTAALNAHRVRQLQERLAWGPAWVDTGLVFTREDGQVMHPEHVTKRFAAGAGRRPAADHPARRAPQLCDRGAGGRRAARGRVRAARACQQLDHRQPLPARAAVDGRAHR
jgi:integrase